MLRSLVPRILRPASHSRLFATQLAATSTASGSEPLPPPPAQTSQPSHAQPESALPYRVRRNTRGSIPVYTDIRNGGTRYLVLIRNVEGSVDSLVQDLQTSLFPAGSAEAERMKISTNRQRHVVLSGGRWKNDVIRWLVNRGF